MVIYERFIKNSEKEMEKHFENEIYIKYKGHFYSDL